MVTYSSNPELSEIQEPARTIKVLETADVCVIGGGAAGVAAAVAAARQGCKVVLLERFGFLGGTLTSVSLGSICGLYAVSPDSIDTIVGGIATEIVSDLQELNGARSEPMRWLETASLPYDLFGMKVVLDRLVAEAGAVVHLHALVADVVMDGERISHLLIEDKRGRWALAAKQFIDASGDAEIATKAGAPFTIDHENLQFPTAMFRFGGVDPEAVQTLERPRLHSLLEQAVADGLPLPRTAGGIFMEKPGVVHLNITKVAIDGRAPDPLDPAAMSRAEVVGREQVLMYQEAFRRYVPGFSSCYVLDSGATLGVRESRRITGKYVLTKEDVVSSARFDDAIGCCAWPMEDHAAGRATRWLWLEPGTYYQIPYRALLPRGVENLLVAGRCASSTHDAQASLRVSAQCFVMGQAAGTAAALTLAQSTRLNQLPIDKLQTTLADAGAFLG